MHRESLTSNLAKPRQRPFVAALPQPSAERLCPSGMTTPRIGRGYAAGLLFAFVIFLLAASTVLAQRRTADGSIPSPRSVLAFNPGDDRTVADWKHISEYFARIDETSER